MICQRHNKRIRLRVRANKVTKEARAPSGRDSLQLVEEAGAQLGPA